MDVFPSHQGRIEVICGPMFAGKTEELVRRVRRCVYADQKTVIFSRDTRNGKGQLITHSGNAVSVMYAEDALDILKHDLTGVDVVGIDEAQFFGEHLAEVATALSDQNIRVIVAGLDMDSECLAFSNVAAVMGVAEYVSKISAICVTPGCSSPATRSFRIVTSNERILEGSEESYKPLCRYCYTLKSQ